MGGQEGSGKPLATRRPTTPTSVPSILRASGVSPAQASGSPELCFLDMGPWSMKRSRLREGGTQGWGASGGPSAACPMACWLLHEGQSDVTVGAGFGPAVACSLGAAAPS